MNSTQTIKLAAVSRNYFNMPIWVATHCDLFKEENLQVDIELHEPINEVTERLEKGRVQLALGVTEHVILNHEAGGTLTIIGGNVNKLPFSLIVKPSIKEFSDLKNKVIGVSSKLAGSSSLIMKILETQGLNYPKDYELAEVGPILARWEKLQSGEIDAGLQGTPLNQIALEQGFNSIVEPKSYFPHFQFTSLNVDARWAQNNLKLLAGFMRAFIKAHRLFFSDQKLMRDIAIKETGISGKHADSAWKEYTEEDMFSINGEFSIKGIQCLIDESALIRSIAKRRGRNAADYVNSQFITEALGMI